MPILGIVAASGGFTKFGDFYQIASSTATGGAVSDITFSSIPQDYTHLQIRGIARSTRASVNNDQIMVQLNSDTATNYSYHRFYGDGTSASSLASTTIQYVSTFYASASTSTSGIFGSTIIDILDYNNTNKFKTLRMIGGHDNNGSGIVSLFSGNWRSTSAVTSIKLFSGNGDNLAQYSSFALYGIKA
jgi:hypothetical protein